MDRTQALGLVQEHVSKENLIKHMLATEAVMRAVAERLDQDVELWGLAGLLHDCDLDVTEGDPAKHGKVGASMLRELGLDEVICRAVERHPGLADPKPETTIEVGLRAADQVTGLVTAAALIHPSKSIQALKIKSLKKRMKEQRFAAAVDRDAIRLCEQIDVPIAEFLELSRDAMGGIAEELGLDGRLAR